MELFQLQALQISVSAGDHIEDFLKLALSVGGEFQVSYFRMF